MTTDSLTTVATVAEEYNQLASEMGAPLIDVRQPPKLWTSRLEIALSESPPVAGWQPDAAMLVADDLAAAMRVAYQTNPSLRAISGNFRAVKTGSHWLVAYVTGGETKPLFEVRAEASGENLPNKRSVTIDLPEPAWQREYVPGCTGKYSLSSALTAYAIRLENHVQQEHR